MALLRSDFRAFLQKVFAALNPGQDYIPSWHIEAIAYQLQRVLNGEITRLIINMPPRSLKSITASVALPAFALGHDPTKRFICVSYSGELAKKHSNDFRTIMQSEWYKNLFPESGIGPFKNNETEIELIARGFRLATSIGGTLTGRGGDVIVIDDPLKPEDAMSETKRNAPNEWFRSTLLSRLDNKSEGAIIVVMQRLHLDDLTGFLQRQSDEWTVLELPAIAECDQSIVIGPNGVHDRKIGDVLSPEREPIEVLEELKKTLGSDAFEAQYQQRPVPPGGAMVKRDWIQRYKHVPPENEHQYVLLSLDTASKGGPNNDWSVCTVWLACKGKRRYLLDVWRRRVDYPTLKDAMRTLARRHKPRKILIEDAGTGIALVQELGNEFSGVIAVKPHGDKIARMAATSDKFRAGKVFLPETASWLADLETELFAFPGARHDDQCDSISQALENDTTSFWSDLTEEDWKKLLADSSIPDPRFRKRY